MDAKIVVFSCNWDGWSCVEAATGSGFRYPASVRVVRVSCLSRIPVGLILKAFELRADGVMLLGCEPGSCHFDVDSACVRDEYEKTRRILEMLGIRKERLVLALLPAFDGHQFAAQIAALSAQIERMPAFRRAKIASSASIEDSVIRKADS